jgi:hypothetical protein
MKHRTPAGDQTTESYTFINRRNLMKLLCLAGINMGFAIAACDVYNVDAQVQTGSNKENSMESIQSAQSIPNKIPLIDAEAAPVTETATFALG